jgi:hypothetical protein
VDNPASASVLRKLGFEPVGRGRIISTARGHDVDALTYWLDAKRALERLPDAQAHLAVDTPRWRAWLGRIAGRPV